MCIQNKDIPIYNPIEPDNFDFFLSKYQLYGKSRKNN